MVIFRLINLINNQITKIRKLYLIKFFKKALKMKLIVVAATVIVKNKLIGEDCKTLRMNMKNMKNKIKIKPKNQNQIKLKNRNKNKIRIRRNQKMRILIRFRMNSLIKIFLIEMKNKKMNFFNLKKKMMTRSQNN